MEGTRTAEIESELRKSACARNLALAAADHPIRFATALGAVAGIDPAEDLSGRMGAAAQAMVLSLCAPHDAGPRLFTYCRQDLLAAPVVSFALPIDSYIMKQMQTRDPIVTQQQAKQELQSTSGLLANEINL